MSDLGNFATPGAIKIAGLQDGNTILTTTVASTTYAPKASPVFTGSVKLPIYTTLTLPAVVVGAMIVVSDAAGSGLCVGVGAAWIDVNTGVAVVAAGG